MLTPNQPSFRQTLLNPINYQRALEIANTHIENPQYERTIAWYYVGRNRKFDLDAIKKELKAEKVEHSFAFYQRGNNFVSKHFEFEHYDIRVTNPKAALSQLVVGKNTFPLTSIQVYSAGNIEYAGILFDCMKARVKQEFIPELESQGFECWAAKGPYEPIEEGLFRNVYTIEESFGPGAKEWMEAMLKGEGPECIIIKNDGHKKY